MKTWILGAVALGALAIPGGAALAGEVSVARGAQVAITSGCHDCHTNGYAESGGKVDPAAALKGTGLFQSIYIWPYAIAAPAAGVAFRFMFSPQAGLVGMINKIWPGIWDPSIVGWQALAMVIVCHAWLGIGYNFIFFLAALQMIPRTISEAGAMDGARPFRRLMDLQLPLIAPTTFFLIIMNLISSFTDSFGLIDTMTEGGPVGSTELMVYKIYFDGFKGLDYSGAAARTLSLKEIYKAGEAAAYETFLRLRWPETNGEAVCPDCGCCDVYAITTRRRFKCAACYKQFSVTSGTIFASRKLSFVDLLAAICQIGRAHV